MLPCSARGWANSTALAWRPAWKASIASLAGPSAAGSAEVLSDGSETAAGREVMKAENSNN